MSKATGGWLGLTLLVALGCTDQGPVGKPAGPAPMSTAGSPAALRDCEGYSCSCEHGTTSVTKCDAQGQRVCDCSKCPAFDPTAGETPFTPCGGTPIGSWQMTGHDLSSIKGYLYQGSDIVGCDSDAKEIRPADLRLALDESGDAHVSFDGGALAFSVANSCVQEVLSGCGSVKNCTLGECGICTCSETRPDLDTEAEWSIANGQLAITNRRDFQHSYEYCVTPSQLTLQDTRTFERFTLGRPYCAGTPLPCSTFRADDGYDEAACVGQPGCMRKVGCIGEAPCSDQAVPATCQELGCEWASFATCDGPPPPACESRSEADCLQVAGCTVVTDY